MDTADQLWDAFRTGDMEAFGNLYHRYYRPLYNYGFTIFADKEVVMDCLHEMFLDLWERRERLPSVKQVKYYLLVAFRRRIIQVAQASRLSNDDIPEVKQASVEDQFVIRESQLLFDSRFKEAFNKLPHRRREAIYLRYGQELSYDQIVNVMGIEYQTARDLVSKGIKSLRKELQSKDVAGSAAPLSTGILNWST
ncbi:MAG: sigma-70 family RNA polymerase sigma factor [Solitalea sp.]